MIGVVCARGVGVCVCGVVWVCLCVWEVEEGRGGKNGGERG